MELLQARQQVQKMRQGAVREKAEEERGRKLPCPAD